MAARRDDGFDSLIGKVFEYRVCVICLVRTERGKRRPEAVLKLDFEVV